MLRNIFFDKKKSVIHHWTYDENDESVYKKVHFKPYLYIPTVESKRIDAYGIDDVPLIKREFDSEWNRYEFLKTYKGKKYFNLPTTQQYLLENYYQKDISELTAKALRMFYYDIEVIADEFPHAEDAKFPITSITIYDTKTLKYYVWGIKPYDHYSCKDHLKGIEPEEIVYDYCKTETDLLKKLLRFWRANFPDLLVGFNSYSFDLPYIVHRMEKVLGEGKSSQLSPVDYIKGHEKENKFAQTYIEYDIGGISHLDYMVLYKTFTPGERESDSLEFICQSELGVGKLDHGSDSLQDMAHKEWDRFINYNVWDVKLMIMLEDKKRYLEVAKFSAYSGFCNLDKALGKVAIITGIIAKQGLLKNQIISTQDNGEHEKIPGGYVKDPEPGLYDNIMVMDLNSLYPNTIITLNISPETKVGKIMNRTDDNVAVYLFKKNTMVDIPANRFREILEKKNWCLSAAGIIFDQTKKGLCAEFVDELYQKRKSVKGRMLKLENELNNIPKDSVEYKQKKGIADRLDVEQYLYKILLNSTYGALANRFFALYDLDCGKSITMTGQALIKESERIANKFITEHWQLEDVNRVTAADTDSIRFDSIIRTDVGTMTIEQLFDLCQMNAAVLPVNNHEVVDTTDRLKCMTYDSEKNEACLGKVKCIIRHKVTKKKYKLSTKNKTVYVTDDHSCMVMRDEKLIEIKPSEILLTDKLVTIRLDIKIKIEEIESIEECGWFEDEYVYDIQMEDDTDHTFFANDILVHNSAILCIDDILKKLGSDMVDDDGDLTPAFNIIDHDITINLNLGVNKWAKETWNSNDCRFEFKRESACPRAIWVAKKHYVMHIKNSEGVKMDKFKYKGLSVVKSTFSENTKAVTKSIVRGIFESPDRKKAEQFFFKSYDSFFQLPTYDVATRSSIKVLNKWAASGFDTAKGCPRHVKWSLYYNHLLKELKLDNKYAYIAEGKKIKMVYVKPNIHNIEGIAFLDDLPEEFELVVDHEKMFEKCVTSCLEPIFNALKWHVPNPKKQHEISLEDIFG